MARVSGRLAPHAQWPRASWDVSVCSSAATLSVSSASRHSSDYTTLMMQGAVEDRMESTEDAALRSPHEGDGSQSVPHNILAPPRRRSAWAR